MKTFDRRIQIRDLSRSDVLLGAYDVAIFGCGHEDRCINLPQLVRQRSMGNHLILSHKYDDDANQYKNESYYRRNWGSDLLYLSSTDETALYEALRDIVDVRNPRILVDYSSMSRLWYNGIINWSKYSPMLDDVTIDFAYSCGEYHDEYSPLVIHEILALPGCEASLVHGRPTTALFGLGFDGAVALTVADRLEPNTIYTYLASPGSSQEYLHVARRKNRDILDMADLGIEIPMRSVSAAVSYLRELIAPDIELANILIIPLGPKPHVLASMLVSHMMPRHVSCLRISGKRKKRVNVSAQGDIVATRIVLNDRD